MTHLDSAEELYFMTIEKYTNSYKSDPISGREILYKMMIRYITGAINQSTDKNLIDSVIKLLEATTKEFKEEIIKGR